MCNGRWEKCDCIDCTRVKELYENIEWLSDDREFNAELIKEMEDEIKGMGYFM